MSAARLARLRRLFRLLTLFSPRLAARVFLDRFAHPGLRRLETIDRGTLAKAQRRQLPFEGGALEVYEWGTGGAPAVLVLHGWGSHAPRFSAFIEAMLAHGWRVIAFDAPGHGRSTGKGSSLMQFRAALDAVVQARGPVQGFIAHSLGALALALRLADAHVAAQGQTKAAVLISMPRDAAYLMDLYLDAVSASAAVRAAVRTGFIARYGLPIEALSGLAEAHSIACPVLIVHDAEDESVPFAHARQLQALLPHGSLFATQGLGHNRLLRDPATVEAVVDFLAAAFDAGGVGTQPQRATATAMAAAPDRV